ncbi:MAG: cysteine--tRNA ligase [archaeon]|nr:cysteine--tRNA ligase [archaeon]
MVLKLYNTLTRKKETFKPINKGKVGLYECGPTVYSYPHIGNMLRYIFGDILTRVLIYDGYRVKRVMNVTDVGHLTSDSDTGDDKMEKAASKEGKTASDIANFYWIAFKEDFNKLNIKSPDIWCKATEHIKEQIAMIKILEKKGFTYKTSDGIYFDTSKLKNYGKLSLLQKENIKAGARINLGDKRNNTDFALWKFSEKPGVRQQEWPSPWRVGFPGWHIECSAMSSKYLGEHFDIHTGGIDNMFPHHENEIAQSETASGKKFVNYWLHNNFLSVKGEKVSKSKGGLYTISELEELGYKPLHYRYMCLLAHYKSSLDFSLELLNAAKNGYESLKNRIELIDNKSVGENAKNYLDDFQKSIDNDLDMPKALQVLQALLKDEKVSGKAKLDAIEKMDSVFGLDLLKKEKIDVSSEVKKLAEERWTAKKNKDFKKADELRQKVLKLGFTINDKPDGFELKKS